jgi:hypothetical protein
VLVRGGQDSNPIFADGYYSNTLANFGANGTVGTGDRIYSGVFTTDLRRCLGFKVIVVTDDDIAYGGVEMNISIR